MKRSHLQSALAALCLAAGFTTPALADLILVGVDNHMVLNNGVLSAAKDPPPDLLAIVDAKSYPPQLIGTVEVPASAYGAPASIWVARDESWAIVTAATKVDPQDATKFIDDDRVSVIDLTASPARIVQTIQAGKGADEVAVSSDGRLALVTNPADATVSVFDIQDKKLTARETIDIGIPNSQPSSLRILPGDKTALLSLLGDNSIAILDIAGGKVTLDKRRLHPGVKPYTLDVTADGKLAAVAVMRDGPNGGAGTVALIDLTSAMFPTVDSVVVPSWPEGINFSPDGEFIAVASANGTTQPSSSPSFHDHGTLWMLAVRNKHLTVVAKATTGPWSQGVAFSRDGRTVLVESMTDHGLDTFRWNGKELTRGPTLDVKGGAAAIRTSWP